MADQEPAAEWKPPSEIAGNTGTMNIKVDRRKETFDTVATSEMRKQEKNTVKHPEPTKEGAPE